MYPIVEPHEGHCRGHDFEDFVLRFTEICAEHIRTGRAQAFSFIFYETFDGQTQSMLGDEAALRELDKLSGDRLTVFFMQKPSAMEVSVPFNEHFLGLLGIKSPVRLPCIAFFTLQGDVASDFKLAPFEPDFYRVFHQIYSAIEGYLKMPRQLAASGGIRLVAPPAQQIAVQVIQQAMGQSSRA